MSLIGLDVGTNGCKAGLFGEDGRLLGYQYREYPLRMPRPGWVELDSELVLDSAFDCLKRLEAARVSDRPVGIAISSQGEAVTPVGSRGEILSKAIVSYDIRTTAEVAHIERELGRSRVIEITGQPAHTMFSATNLMWVKKNQPELFQGAVKWLTFEDLLGTRLGAEPALDYTMAARTLAFDIRRKEWSEEMMEVAGLEPSAFSKPVPSATPLGTVSGEAARALNLPAGIEIVAGGHDQPCSALGAGVIEPGCAADGMGTVECVTAVVDRPLPVRVVEESNTPCYNHVVPEKYVVLAYVMTGGSVLRWFRDTIGPGVLGLDLESEDDFYERALEAVLERSEGPSGLLFLPHMAGSGTPWSDPESKGAIVGLSLSSCAADIYRAILEGTAFEIRENMSCLDRAGVLIEGIFATGGGSRSGLLLQLKADVTGKPIKACRVAEASSLGAAIIAGVGCGVFESFEAGVASAVGYREMLEPDPDLASAYDGAYEKYKRLYPAVKSVLEG